MEEEDSVLDTLELLSPDLWRSIESLYGEKTQLKADLQACSTYLKFAMAFILVRGGIY